MIVIEVEPQQLLKIVPEVEQMDHWFEEDVADSKDGKKKDISNRRGRENVITPKSIWRLTYGTELHLPDWMWCIAFVWVALIFSTFNTSRKIDPNIF
jgi:hypothetical protein